MKLEGKVAIVTGTSPNIGGGIAQGLAEEGCRVACVDSVADNARQCASFLVQLIDKGTHVLCLFAGRRNLLTETVERGLLVQILQATRQQGETNCTATQGRHQLVPP